MHLVCVGMAKFIFPNLFYYLIYFWRNYIYFYSKSRHLLIISLKNSYLFKIIKLVISFCLKKNFWLNNFKHDSFSRTVDHIIYPLWGPYNFSYFCYYLWALLHFLVVFMSPTVLFQLIFTLSTVFSIKKFQFQQNKRISNKPIYC